MKVSPHSPIQRSENPQADIPVEKQIPVTVIKNTEIQNSVCADYRYKSQLPPGLGAQEVAKNHCWIDVCSNVDQAALKDAHKKMPAFASICSNYGINIISRHEKTKARIDAKKEIVANDTKSIKRAGYVDHFKVVQDFMAGRVYCNVTDIQTYVDKFKQLAHDHDGWCAIKGAGDDTFGAHKKNGEFIDIIQYLFVYLPEMGHVAELQIGHEFTGLTFTVDSFLRDNKKPIQNDPLTRNDPLPISIWGDEKRGTNLYDTIKKYLLTQSNNPQDAKLVEMRKECQSVAERLYAGTTIPEDIQRIINNL